LCRNASIGIVITDEWFTIHMINAAAARLFDVDQADAAGRQVSDLMPENRRQLARRLLERVKATSRSSELRILYPAGAGNRHISLLVDPIAGTNGETEGLCLWVRDQTQRMKLERRLARIDKLAGMGQLAGGLAHHLNNVLGGIVTAVDHGSNAEDVTTMKRSLELASAGLSNAVKLTRKLLEFASHDLPDRNLVDLTEAVISFVEQAQDRLRRADREIDLEIKSAPVLAVHQFKIQQVLDSLLTNSEQALGERGGRINISLEPHQSSVRLFFRDDGPGIPSPMTERVFDPFFTTRGTLGGGAEGNLGLGLTLARRLVGEIGGSLSFCPQQGARGACFVLEFPLRRSHSGRAE